MASDAACIDSAAGSMCPFAQFHGGGGADESGQLPVDADSKEGMLVQILMRQSQTLFGGVFLRRACGFPGGTFQFAPMVGFSNQGLVCAEVHATYVDAPRVSLRGAFLGLFAFLVGVDDSAGVNTPNPPIFTERPIPISWARASPSSQIIPSVTPFENPEVMAMYSASSRVPVCPVITILG